MDLRSEEFKLEKEDLVMIAEPNVSRGMWQIGRVIEVYPGKDGRVRSAQVKTRSGNPPTMTPSLVIF